MPARNLFAQDRRNLLAGAIFAASGMGVWLIATRTLSMGTPAEMGPGFFPSTIGVVLAVLGVMVALSPTSDTAHAPRPIPWRAGLFLVAAILFAALFTEPLGLVPMVIGSSLLGACASTRMTLRFAVALAAGLTMLSVAIFKLALNLPLPLIGPWIGG